MASKTKIFHFDEVVKHNERGNCWLLIHNKVFDVTHFLEEHPGGDEVIIAATGKDATDDYEDIGHSESAKQLMMKYCIGDVDVKSVPVSGKKYQPPASVAQKPSQNEWLVKLLQFLLPLIILGAAFALRSTVKKD